MKSGRKSGIYRRVWVAGGVVGVVWSSLLQIGPRRCGVRVVWGFEVGVRVLRNCRAPPHFPPVFPPLSKASSRCIKKEVCQIRNLSRKNPASGVFACPLLPATPPT